MSSVPWLASDWWDGASAWIGERLRAADVGAVRTIARHRVSSASFVARVETDRDAFFFKAVLPTERPEAPLVAQLGEFCSGLVPDVVAFDAARRWMLTRAVAGRSLLLVSDLEPWTTALERFGRMQRDCALRVDALTAIGCPIVSLRQVVDQFDELVEPGRLGQLSLPLTTSEWRQLRPASAQWRELADEPGVDGVPEATLDHADLHPNNIVVTDKGCVFLDWDGGAIGHPFLAPHVFLGYVAQLLPDLRGAMQTLRDAYLRAWTGAAAMPALAAGFDRLRPIACVKFAVGVVRWHAQIAADRSTAADRAVAETVTRCLRTALASTPAAVPAAVRAF